MKTKLFRKIVETHGRASLIVQTWRATSLLLLLLATAPAFAQPNLTVCAGQGFMITSKADAQSISGGVTYTWQVSVDDGSYTVVPDQTAASLPVPSGQSVAGTYAYVRYAASDACSNGVPTKPYTVVVQALPVIETVSAPTVCAGSYTIITAEPQLANATYTWTAYENTWTTTSNTTTINACTTTGSGSVFVASQCKSAISTYTITVAQPAAAGSSAYPCGCQAELVECSGECVVPSTAEESVECTGECGIATKCAPDENGCFTCQNVIDADCRLTNEIDDVDCSASKCNTVCENQCKEYGYTFKSCEETADGVCRCACYECD